jgi:ferredoxin-NADP reductase
MQGRNLHRLGAAGGQFFNWRFMDSPGWTGAHPFSLSAAPQSKGLRITVKTQGDGSGRLATMPPGTRVLVEGPYGRLHPGVRSRPKVTLLASGIGITPMRALMEELDHVPGELHLIYRASTDEDFVLRDDIDEVAARTGASVHYIVGRRARHRPQTWLPENGSHLGEAEALLHLVPDLAEHEVFICGADAWMDAARDAVLEAGVPSGHVHLERFTW